MLNPKTTPTMAVKIKRGHAYHGTYRVDVTHLPTSLLGHLIMLIVFTGAFVPLLLLGAPQWVVWPIGLIAAEALMNLLIRAFQLARHSGDHS